ncbi:MAG: type II toxin-antitoxin system PemK/MazF family toxin [Prevotellaceae bacterium]|nr:type II toxin-antitoxin system PemK/MazF family toxin [Prevotellaceae bacterium]
MKEIMRGDIFYVQLDPVVGSEQGGARPCVVLQNNIGNKFSTTVIVAAVTGREIKKKLPTHAEISLPELGKDSTVLLEQIRTIDKQRLREFVGTLTAEQLSEVEKALDISLGRAGI